MKESKLNRYLQELNATENTEQKLTLPLILRTMVKKRGIKKCPFSRLIGKSTEEVDTVLTEGNQRDKCTINDALLFNSFQGYKLWLDEINSNLELLDQIAIDTQGDFEKFMDDAEDFFAFMAWRFISSLSNSNEDLSENSWKKVKEIKPKNKAKLIASGFRPALQIIGTAAYSLKDNNPKITQKKGLEYLKTLKKDLISFAYGASNGISIPGFTDPKIKPWEVNQNAFRVINNELRIDPRYLLPNASNNRRKIQTGCAPFFQKIKFQGVNTTAGSLFIDILNEATAKHFFNEDKKD